MNAGKYRPIISIMNPIFEAIPCGTRFHPAPPLSASRRFLKRYPGRVRVAGICGATLIPTRRWTAYRSSWYRYYVYGGSDTVPLATTRDQAYGLFRARVPVWVATLELEL